MVKRLPLFNPRFSVQISDDNNFLYPLCSLCFLPNFGSRIWGILQIRLRRMSKPPPRLISGLLRLHFNRARNPIDPNPLRQFPQTRGFGSTLTNPNGFPISGSLASKTHTKLAANGFSASKLNSPGSFNRFSWRKYWSTGSKLGNVSCKSLCFQKLEFNPLGIRCFSIKTPGIGSKIDAGITRKVFQKPVSAVTSSISRYREAVSLQIEGFLKRNYLFLLGSGAVFVCIFLWRIMFGIANTFVGLSEGMAKYGFLALSSSMVAFAGLYLRSRYKINPDAVYRMAMRKLNTSASILEVMGTPLVGTDLRAYVMSGGGISLSKLKPHLRSKRCFLIFPVQGSERKGLVSVEVKKKKGQYDMKLLAVDIPMTSGPDQRLFLIGDEEEYTVGGGLIAELRDPVVKAMAATKEFESLDQIEDEEDAQRELQEAETKHRQEIENLKTQTGDHN